MAMQLDGVVPFGRSLDEYREMFLLSHDDLEKNVIGVADGPASFNTEMHALGKRVISVDPLYALRPNDIKRRFYEVAGDIIQQVKGTPEDWVWTYHRSPDHLLDNRVHALSRFLADFEAGYADGRYMVGELPRLAFRDREFDLALCSHFLFLYSDHFSYEFHLASVAEMIRVAREVRIFPLMTLKRAPSPYLRPLLENFQGKGYMADIRTVRYELQRGGNQMLVIRKKAL